MTTKDEALKLALEALEEINKLSIGENAICLPAEIDTAMDAIREALAEQPAQQQEPVAWRNAALRVGEDLCSVGPFGYYDMTAEQWLDWALSVVTVHAPPASKPWVGLTDEEIDECYYWKDRQWTTDELVRYVEAKLREKNA